ncbi:MAG: radical SAM/Cys-rich domain protein [Bacteroidetes bacterium]|nr:radical SAM/Cys-rich domain protein [Bacteroidota bacterium]
MTLKIAQQISQLNSLREIGIEAIGLPRFEDKIKESGLSPLKPDNIEIFQINLGNKCNQACKHCHVEAGPNKNDMVSKKNLLISLEILKNHNFKTVDLTGGAPEMHPHFKWFVEEISALNKGINIIVRCNLTIILVAEEYSYLPEFYKKHKVEVVSSLPFYEATKTNRMRGRMVFETSIKALQLLNKVGYGIEGSGLKLNLVYNPAGAFLPSSQDELKQKFKEELKSKYDVVFNDLFTITNMPIGRFLNFLLRSGNLKPYMEKLVSSYNPCAAENVMCRNTLSTGWDGQIYDCDFNQMLGLPLTVNKSHYLKNFDMKELKNRNIALHEHCYGCAAGAGSSCAGEIA